MPEVNEILDDLHGASIYSTLDLTAGYWQITLDEESKLLTAFSWEGKQYVFNVLSSGLKNAPAIFMRIMKNVPGDFEFIRIYLDDIIIRSKSEEEHSEHVRIFLERIDNAKLGVNPQKIQWSRTEVKILDLIISNNSIKLNPEEISAVT